MNRRLRLALGIFALLVASCTRSDADLERSFDPPTSETKPTTAPTAPSTSDSTPADAEIEPIVWEGCDGGECAFVEVPLDHGDPDGDTIDVFVRRRPATGDRIGALFFNFGGPGADAADLINAFPVPAGIQEHFDVVGMDPRGVGRSTSLDCGLDPVALYSVDPTIEDQTDAQALVDVSQQYADDCEVTRGDLLPHVGTRDVARDMDRLRAGMGDEQISYVGYSYGTSIGQAYAEQFPDRVRAMVLDGVVDTAPPGIDVAIAQADGFETALASWAAGCPGRSSCRFGSDATGAVEQVLDVAEDGVASSGGARTLGPGEAAIALAYPLYQRSQWPALDGALAEALDGDGRAMVGLADAYTRLVDFSIYFAVSCLDSSWPRSTVTFLERAADAGHAAPHFGEAIVNDYLRCAVWPAPPDPLGAISAPGTPPILVVSTTGDPATPYDNGVRVAERLEAGVLLTHEGEGHTIVFQGSSCVDRLARAYLVDLAVPDEGARC